MKFLSAVVVAVPVLLASMGTASLAVEPAALVPRVGDETRMWWADGFPGNRPSAPWIRVVQTGSYAMALNTETLQIPHFGVVTGIESDEWRSLPPAELALKVTVDGKTYRCTSGAEWSRWGGPRLIESGRFFQRADVTDLVFVADDGARLNADARFETAAWPERLGMVLAVRPGRLPIEPGEGSFGRVGGGFGLDGTNHFEIPPDAFPVSEQFTVALWTFVPVDYRASEKTLPWLLCKNANELADGNLGIMIGHGEVASARMNFGGGRDNAVVTEPVAKRPLKLGGWNHLAMSYDGDTLRLFVNGGLAGEKQVGRKWRSVSGAMAVGRRQDNWGDGYRFRGVVDEIRLYDRALTIEELRRHWNRPEIVPPALKANFEWIFRPDGKASMTKLSEQWENVSMEMGITRGGDAIQERWQQPEGDRWTASEWRQVAVSLGPVAFEPATKTDPVTVQASGLPRGAAREVTYDASIGWHRVNLDGIEPTLPPAEKGSEGDRRNEALERVKLVLENSSEQDQVTRLMFEKTARGIRQRIGTPITGISAILRDREGNPTGIPVQISKNWHRSPEGGVYEGQWFHGISQVRLPARAQVELELTIAYGHWGGVPAASHAQLCLVGWGSNQLWDQSALGSWGESICYDPDQVQRGCTITDVRPLMVRSMRNGEPWGWTNNVGGGDFFALFDPSGNRLPRGGVRTNYQKQGPCLTEVTYAGRLGKGMTHSTKVSLGRTDDIVRGVYRVRLDVKEATDISRFVIFQVGADNYNASAERKLALGNETGLIKEWNAAWGGGAYRTEPMECLGRLPWVSLHEAQPVGGDQESGAWANRGIVVRSWKARLGGKEAKPWIAERGLAGKGDGSSIIDFVPPPGVVRLEPGDFVEATFEHVVIPQFAKDYYGPNEGLRAALVEEGNTWRLILREAVGNDRVVDVTTGTLLSIHPAIALEVDQDRAEFSLAGGLGYVPITFHGLASPVGVALLVDGKPLNQAVHGNDFWQTDFDPTTGKWSRTYNLQMNKGKTHRVELEMQ